MRFVDNGLAKDFSELCFKGMTVPISRCGLKYDIRKGDFIQPEEELTQKLEADARLELPVEDLEIGTRASNCLRRAKIETVGQLVQLTKLELLNLRSLGAGTADEIEEAVHKMGLSLRTED